MCPAFRLRSPAASAARAHANSTSSKGYVLRFRWMGISFLHSQSSCLSSSLYSFAVPLFQNWVVRQRTRPESTNPARTRNVAIWFETRSLTCLQVCRELGDRRLQIWSIVDYSQMSDVSHQVYLHFVRKTTKRLSASLSLYLIGLPVKGLIDVRHCNSEGITVFFLQYPSCLCLRPEFTHWHWIRARVKFDV